MRPTARTPALRDWMWRDGDVMTNAHACAASGSEHPTSVRAKLSGRIDEARRVLNRLLQQTAVDHASPSARQRLLPALDVQEADDTWLRDENERLVMAILGPRELRDALQQAQHRYVDLLVVVADELQDPQAPVRLAASVLGSMHVDQTLLPRVQSMLDAQLDRMRQMLVHLDGTVGVHLDPLRRPHDKIDLRVAVHGAVERAQRAMSARRQHVELQLCERPLEVVGDRERLLLVVANLLDNASKFSAEGQRIGVRGGCVAGSVVLEVYDTGIGIAPAGTSQIFEPFWHDAEALVVAGAGVGIGLTVVRWLVESHGGTVQARSAGRGRGSCLLVTLPAVQA